MTLNKELIVSGDQIRKYMSGSNFAIPIDAMKEFGDNYKHMIGVLGIKGQNKDLSQGVGLDVLAEEMNGVFGTNFDSSNALNAMNSIYEALVKDGVAVEDLTKKQQKYEASTVEMTQYLDRLYESINKVRAASQSVDENGFLTGEGVDGIGFDAEDILGVETTSKEVTNALNEVQQEIRETQELANPFEGIVKGLGTLQGINITADQFAGIRVLADSLGKLVGSNGEKAGIILPQIASGLAAMAGIHLPDNATQLAALGQAIGAFGSKAATRAQGLPQLVEGLRQLQYVKIPDVSGVYDLAAALSKLGGAKIETAIQNMPRLTAAFIDMIAAISAAPTVSAETVQLAQAMAQLATSSRTVGQATQKSTTGINLLRGAVSAALPTFKKAQHHTFSLAAAFGKLYASYFLIIRGVKKLGEAINYSSKLTEVQNVVAHTFGDATNKVDEFANRSIEDFGMAELAAKQFASRFQAMGTTMGISSKQIADANDLIYNKIVGNEDAYEELGDSMADVSLNLTKLTADYASFFNLDYEDVADDMASIFTGQTRPMRQYGIDLTNATLQEWAMKNGLDANIKAMTQAEKTMLRYQYVMANSAHIMGDFERTKNTWANVVRTIGQQFQKLGRIIGEGLINTFKPLLIRFREFMNTILDLTEKALNAIGKLLGWQIEIEEVGVTMNDGMEDYADSVGTAADNAKKLNAQLRSIDELNNLTSPNNGDNGGGSEAYGGGGAGENKVSGGLLNVKKYESDINSWLDLGNRIRDKIIDAITGINWEEISQKVKQNAKNLVDLLKGLLLPDDEGRTLGGAIGEFLAQGINLGLDWLVTSTGDMALWGAAGENIADFFIKFFETVKWGELAEVINNICEGLVTMISAAAEKLKDPDNRKKIHDKIGEFFKKLDPQTIGVLTLVIEGVTIARVLKWTFASGIPALLKAALERLFLGNPVKVNIATDVTGGVVTGVTQATSSTEVATAAASLGTAIGVAAGAAAVVAISGYDLATNGAEKRAEYLGQHKVDNGKLNKDDAYKIEQSQLWKSSGTAGANLDMWIVQTLFGDLFNKIFHPEHTGGGAGHSFGEEIGEEITAGIEEGAINEVKSENSKSKWQEIKDNIIESLEIAFGIHSPATTAYPIGENIILGIFEGFNLVDFAGKMQSWWNTNVLPWFTRERWATLGENIKLGLTTKWEEFKLWWNNTGLKKWIDDTTEKFNRLRDDITGENGFFAKMQAKASEVWTAIQNIFNQGFDIKLPHLSWDESNTYTVTGLLGKTLEKLGLPTSIPQLKVEWYADGGFPTPGSLFVAGEAGAELLGTMNGRTTVASNGEITGISDTIRSTSAEEIQLLRQQNQLLQSILQKEFGISNGDIFRSVRTSAMEWKKMTGDPAF